MKYLKKFNESYDSSYKEISFNDEMMSSTSALLNLLGRDFTGNSDKIASVIKNTLNGLYSLSKFVWLEQNEKERQTFKLANVGYLTLGHPELSKI